MKIAVVGGGISGLSAAWLLSHKHSVTLFESGHYLGGHTNTVDVSLDGHTHAVDTGFLVHNDLTYPNLIQLFEHLGVETYASEMSFSVQVPKYQLEWSGSSLDTVFGQRRNLMRPHFLMMLRDIISFNAKSKNLLALTQSNGISLGSLLQQQGYSQAFCDWYLLPMAAAIWSSSPKDILDFPAETFLRFCINHRLLQIQDRPTWRSIVGGGRSYVKKMAKAFSYELNSPVDLIDRQGDQVFISTQGKMHKFDAVVLATHAPDSLRMLGIATVQEQQILGSVEYQPNLAILHADADFLPKREPLWSAWNYLSTDAEDHPVCVSYLLNKLQRLPFDTPLLVTLNPPPDLMPKNEIRRFNYHHPVFDQKAIDAQKQLSAIQGVNRTWYCGAWTGYGFHEDGLKSALRIISDFDVEAPWTVSL